MMEEFMQRYSTLGEDFDHGSCKIRQSLRVNTLKTDAGKLMARLNAKLEKIQFLSQGYYCTSDFAIGALPEHFLGLYYMQEAASQIPAEVLSPLPGEKVLDMAAAPGGKTTQMAAMMQNKGIIVALDARHSRLSSLRNNLERCGVANCLAYKKDSIYAEDLKTEFDKILLDAPCSGNFTKEKDWFTKRKLSEIGEIVKLQRKLLKAAVGCAKKGGVIVYSTCSLEPEENELNIDWLLQNFDNVRLENISKKIGDTGLTSVFGRRLSPEVAKCLRIWPHKSATQGFFVAKLIKSLN